MAVFHASKNLPIYFLNSDPPKTKASKKRTIKTKNNILAIDAAPEAIPPKPKIAAIMAITKKVAAQRNIMYKI
jgi:hypothetical protein